MNLAGMMEWSALRHASRPALQYGDSVMTFAEVDEEANRLANALIDLGLRKGDRVGVLIANRPEYMIAELAVAKAGGVRVPMLIRSSVQETIHYLAFSEATAVIASSEGLDVLRSAIERLEPGRRRPDVVALEDAQGGEHDFRELVAGASAAHPGIDLTEDDLYAIRFTGGTTGRPKGVLMSHGTMVAVVQNMLLNWPVRDDDTVCHFHPLSHAAGMLMYTWYVRGARQVILPAFDFKAEALLRTIEEEQITTTFMIPTVLNVLLDCEALDRYDTSSLRNIVYGGAPVPVQRIREALERFGPVLVQLYGSSEAPNVLTTLLHEEHEFQGDPPARLRSAGRVGLGVEVKVVTPEGVECGPGEVGEVISRGPHTMVGYWRDPELTAERTRDGWVHTRDMASFDEEGYLHIVDRKDDMMISGGFNVWPAEVEEAIYRHPAVREVAVFGVEDAKWGEVIVAAVSLKSGAETDEAQLRAFVREHVSRHKVPKRIWFRDSDIPKSAVGKPLRRAVADEYVKLGPHAPAVPSSG